MTRQQDVAWHKNWRVYATAIGWLAAGFLIGKVSFGSPWNLPPAWGDVPTWGLLIVALVTGWYGLRQFRMLVQQDSEEKARNIKRDQLLDRQLQEAEDRAITERRRQAEDIKLVTGTTPSQRTATIFVLNKSNRPINQITADMVSKADGRVAAKASKSGAVHMGTGPETAARLYVPRWEPSIGTTGPALAPNEGRGFLLEDIAVSDEFLLRALFTDDAGFRWQLDASQHLEQVGKGLLYEPVSPEEEPPGPAEIIARR